MGRRKKREPETALIESAAHDGRGIAAIEGKKVFVAGALPGESVEFIRRKSRRKFDEAELLSVLESSPDRINARCDAFGRCGGCSLQHVTSTYQRNIKAQTLRDNLTRIGNVSPEHWFEPMVGPEWAYRRRARLAVKHVPGKGRTLVGFREKHAPFVTDMHRCEVLTENVGGLLDALSELVGSLTICSRLPQIEVAVAENATALVFRVLDTPSEEDRERLLEFGKLHDMRIYLQPGGLDSLQLLYPEAIDESLFYTLPKYDIRIDFEPVDFVQVNAAINEQMVAFALDQLDVNSAHNVMDLYCGIGNFSLPLARLAAKVLGIEGDQSLVARAGANAERNGLSNVSFKSADLSKIDGTEDWFKADWDRMLLDPARSGAAEVVSRMKILNPEKLVYVSCHPGTLARDAGILVHEQGYRLDAAGIIDMFPHTAHVESIAVFSRT